MASESKGYFVLEEYKFITGYCQISNYILDNDSIDSNSFAPMNGIIGLLRTSCSATDLISDGDCRTVEYYKDQITKQYFWIQVEGEGPITKKQTSPQIEIIIGCHSTSFLPVTLTTLKGGNGMIENYYVG